MKTENLLVEFAPTTLVIPREDRDLTLHQIPHPTMHKLCCGNSEFWIDPETYENYLSPGVIVTNGHHLKDLRLYHWNYNQLACGIWDTRALMLPCATLSVPALPTDSVLRILSQIAKNRALLNETNRSKGNHGLIRIFFRFLTDIEEDLRPSDGFDMIATLDDLQFTYLRVNHPSEVKDACVECDHWHLSAVPFRILYEGRLKTRCMYVPVDTFTPIFDHPPK